jgi:hypothetical protein
MAVEPCPVQVEANPEPAPGRWLWLVKWLLLVPHTVILLGLDIAFVVTTLVAYVIVLITGNYPEPLHAFNVGVLRWNWRVGYYGYQALGTDRYPPFTLADVPDYPARLTIPHPGPLPRWRPLVGWLLAVPHLLILGAFAASSSNTGGGVVGVLVLVAAVGLLFTARYLPGVWDLLVGIARWQLRVAAYVALLTGPYPPFRLDQGGTEPAVTKPVADPVTTELTAPETGSTPTGNEEDPDS